jgi:hypothetical protein
VALVSVANANGGRNEPVAVLRRGGMRNVPFLLVLVWRSWRRSIPA